MSRKIAVIGSSNVDFIMKIARLPRAAETVTDGEFFQTYGGKGANQAVAAARAGGEVALLACLGDDMYAPRIMENLEADGIDTGRIMIEKGVSTGTALIMFDAKGENYLSVAPGSNYRLTPGYIERNRDLITESALVMLQMEIPADTTRRILELAGTAGTPVMFNYAPARQLEVPVSSAMTALIVNEVEAGALAGREVRNRDDARDAARELLRRGPREVIVTLGADGAFAASPETEEHIPAFRVKPVDTTAAGDTFCGAFAVARVERLSPANSLRFANAASALSVTRVGAQPSIPKRVEIDAFLKNR